MATNVSRQLESRWKNLIGFALESAFDTFATATKWLPTTVMDSIEKSTELMKSSGALGMLLPKSAGYDDFGLGKGKLALKMDAVPLSNNITHLLAEILSAITTSGASAPYTHTLTIRDASGYALNQDVGLSFTEMRDAAIGKLSGCRATALRIKQEQNKFMEMEIDYEGATFAVASSSGVTPSLTLVSACPFYKFSHLAFTVAGSAVPIVSFELELKLTTTADDGIQPLGTAARTKLDHVGIEPMTIKVKRAYAYDGTNQSSYEADYDAKTARALAATWTYSGDWSFAIAATAARLMKAPKRSVVGGVVMEELEYQCQDNGTDEPFTFTIKDDSATPATRSWS